MHRVKPIPSAARQIRAEARWWRRNRTKAPALFQQELRRAFRLIATYPEAGALAKDLALTGVRRLVLTVTQHYVYYRVNEAERRIDVLAVWGTNRGEPPALD